ncbi:VOC family protein [Saccharopolyspora elongata]|uniref:VOC family protein n=1 Tax=Saccharopolyspora elongata TaxID=2530387 RepID=A0A4R4YAQ7_9PSEU|nr:VOC family protein [Saccharopolyspora elongata]TDD41615.1 VOC family protein [Saccharopolyspora elongata]
MPKVRLGAVALDTDAPAVLATFWSELLGGRITFSSDDFISIDAGSIRLNVHRVSGHRAPSWPDGSTPKQMHLDIEVHDLEAAEGHALRLGARRADAQPAPDRWRVLLDPAGHPFCLTTRFPG